MTTTKTQINLSGDYETWVMARANAFGNDVATRVLSVARMLPSGCVQAYLSREDPRFDEIEVVPSNQAASRIVVGLYSADPANVTIHAGVNAFLSLATDVYQIGKGQWGEFVEKMTRGIIGGTFEETVTYKGGLITKSTFNVNLDGELFTFTRSNLPNWLKTLVKKKRRENIRYAPYVERPTGRGCRRAKQ